ncbi:MAG: hypothetical protein OEX98_02665 [Nitrosopumilus sp.]|nr:hypothetical protein [Nitrosopumilus sp.]
MARQFSKSVGPSNYIKHVFLSQEITTQVPAPQCGAEASLVE